jgi:hypothetical protein
MSDMKWLIYPLRHIRVEACPGHPDHRQLPINVSALSDARVREAI